MSALSVESMQFVDGILLYINHPKDQFSDDSSFNFIYLHHLASEKALLEAKMYMESRCRHYLFVADEKIGESLLTVAPILRLSFDTITMAMALDLEGYVASNTSIDKTIKYASNDLEAWMVPLQNAFSIHDIDTVKKYIAAHRRALNQNNGLYHFVLEENKQVITSLTLTIHENLARLDDIGTIMSHRGQGYATKIIHYALSFAQSKGVRYCFLEASKAGGSLYKKIGFQFIFNYYSFVPALG